VDRELVLAGLLILGVTLTPLGGRVFKPRAVRAGAFDAVQRTQSLRRLVEAVASRTRRLVTFEPPAPRGSAGPDRRESIAGS
jgi:hypothetical protein